MLKPVREVRIRTGTSSRCHTWSVAPLRVYQLARELGIESQVLRQHLADVGEFVPSAASPIKPDVARRACEAFAMTPTSSASGVPVSPTRGRSRARFPVDDYGDDDPWGTCEDEVTTTDAARLCGVKAETIRQWASRGYLKAVGKQGRRVTYGSGELRRIHDEVQRRTRTSPSPRVNVASRDLDALVTGPEAAKIVGVAPSTIRMWVARGHLRAASATGRPTFKVIDVLRAARRRRRR